MHLSLFSLNTFHCVATSCGYKLYIIMEPFKSFKQKVLQSSCKHKLAKIFFTEGGTCTDKSQLSHALYIEQNHFHMLVTTKAFLVERDYTIVK